MPISISFMGELVSQNANDRFKINLKSRDIEKVTLYLPDGTVLKVPPNTKVITEY